MFLDDVVEITLSQGKVAIVDRADAGRVLAFKWTAQRAKAGNWYAFRRDYRTGRKVYLHRFLLDAPPGVLVDHVDGDGLNCRRANMRLATHHQNCTNRRPRGNRSRYKGVVPAPAPGRWEARIGGPTRFLGTFDSETDAAIAYDTAARRKYGDRAYLNFPLSVAEES